MVDFSSHNAIGYNGLNPGQIAFPRTQILDIISKSFNGNVFITIASPAATGKTSILCLLPQLNPQINFVYVRLERSVSAFETLKVKGLDLRRKEFAPGFENTVILLDDAQLRFDETDFWEKLIKEAHLIPSNFRFVVSSTHLLGGADSPAVLKSVTISNICHSDLLLSFQESIDFFNFTGLGDFSKLRLIMANDCCGLIGALRIGIDTIANHFKNKAYTEDEAIQYYFSQEFVLSMDRCFGTDFISNWTHDVKKSIIEVLNNLPIATSVPNDEVRILVKCGILCSKSYGYFFSSPLAKRYFSYYFYPNRSQAKIFSTLFDLVKGVISGMSARPRSPQQEVCWPWERTISLGWA